MRYVQSVGMSLTLKCYPREQMSNISQYSLTRSSTIGLCEPVNEFRKSVSTQYVIYICSHKNVVS